MEPSLKTRRQFLRTSLLASSLSWTVPAFLARTFSELEAQAANSAQLITGKDGPILVVLQMAGGNDGLNTVVPFANDDYHRARPRLALKADAVHKLSDEVGLHPNLNGFKSLFDGGRLGIVQGVGYPNPNRSHFRSTEIWQTASDSERFEKYGWIGRYFDNYCAGADPVTGVNIGGQTPQSFAAKTPVGVSFENPDSYKFAGVDSPNDKNNAMEKSFHELNHPNESEDANAGSSITMVSGKLAVSGSVLDYVERTAMDAQVSSDQIRAISKLGTNKAEYPSTRLATSLKLVARLISGGLPTRVYYVSQGGYDTHTNQLNAQGNLLTELGDSLKAFIADMQAQGQLDRVLVMTFSEFGRRLNENASGGTDHGAAAPMFLAGARIKPGILGRYPSLAKADLLNGDLKYTVDFRSVYAGVLENWLKVPSATILRQQFEPLKFV